VLITYHKIRSLLKLKSMGAWQRGGDACGDQTGFEFTSNEKLLIQWTYVISHTTKLQYDTGVEEEEMREEACVCVEFASNDGGAEAPMNCACLWHTIYVSQTTQNLRIEIESAEEMGCMW
jgi:hypothetical protein